MREYFAAGLLYRDRQQYIWLSGKGLIVVFVVAFVVLFPFFHFGRLDLARPTFVGAIAISVVVAMGWGLRRHVWFWVTLAFLVALHVAVILVVPWGTNWVPAQALVPIVVADLYVMYWIFSLVGKVVEGPQISEELKRPDKL